MTMTLTRGDDSRLDGAPSQDLPNYADMVQEYAIYLVSQDQDGALYGGDPANARQDAIRYVKQMEAAKQAEAEQRRAAGQAAVLAADAERDQMRANRQGVSPESLPMDEYGSVSARTVRDANMPLSDQEAALAQYQALVRAETKDLREGRFHGAAAQARQYEQDYGLPTNPSSTGKTDLDYLREQQAHQGFLRTGRGEMIPMGPAPTPESLASRRGFNEWANESPGTERQAMYDPAAYGEYREGVRQGIRGRALKDMQDFGTGPADSQARADAGLPALTDAQRKAREARSRSGDRVAEAQREVDIARLARKAGVSREEARQMMDAGRNAVLQGRQGDPGPAGAAGQAGAAAPAAGPLTAAERRLESQKLRDMANTRQDALRANDLALRQDNLRNQRLLLAPGGKGVANAINELPKGWRQIAILDRITNGRRGGATPLDVEAQQMANALPVFRSMFAGVMQDMDPNAPEARRMQRELELRRAAGVAKAAGWDKPAAVREALELQGATPAEINMIMTDLFGPGWKPQAAAGDKAVRDAAAGAMQAPPPGI